MAIPVIPDLKTLMDAGVHFGHASGHWHPKMKPYIFATRDKLHIIDLEQTRTQLTRVLTVLESRLAAGKNIVLVGTKKQVSERIKEIGDSHNLSYINVRWPGGVLTNWVEIQKSIARMKRIEEHLSSPDAAKMIKKERVMMESDLRRLHYKFGGLRNMSKKPDALFIVDPAYEHNAVKEARSGGIELFAIVDTNSNPLDVDFAIPANDEGPKSLKLLLDLVEETIANGLQAQAIATTAEEAAPIQAELQSTELQNA